ncbi:hypothetical protein GCM10010255_01560 [Streptomyces coeruleofuscus]|uniref:Uncharacterized protein n=1 Tax=Streptomyces coeruleofuscus TaxID=66879 RepID=A0ABN3HHD3_9ACTN
MRSRGSRSTYDSIPTAWDKIYEDSYTSSYPARKAQPVPRRLVDRHTGDRILKPDHHHRMCSLCIARTCRPEGDSSSARQSPTWRRSPRHPERRAPIGSSTATHST